MFSSLAKSANLAYSIAKDHCRSNDGLSNDCSWYHGSWLFFRTLGLVSDPGIHKPLFIEGFKPLLKSDDFSRVLISGAVDYSMLATVLEIYQKNNTELDVTVVDICQTPLELCQWYAKQQGEVINTITSDILNFSSTELFDVICTHAFMGNFDKRQRLDLVSSWGSLLRIGGKVITVQRIRPGFNYKKARFSRQQARLFGDSVLQQAKKQSDLFLTEAVKIGAMAEEYAQKFFSYPVHSKEEIKQLFTNAGFIVEKLEVHQFGEKNKSSLSGPTIPDLAEYAFIIAVKE